MRLSAAARKVIDAAGCCEFFVHNLGHGVCLEIHEAPVMSPNCKDVLAAGIVLTDKPRIYLLGFGGIRIEDIVLVGRGAGEKLNVGAYYLGK